MAESTLGRWLVAAQFGLLLALAWPWSEPVALLPAGVVAALAAAVGVWTLAHNRPGNFNIRPEPRAGGRLISSGPYRLVRHPMYVAVLLLALAAAIAYASVVKLICLFVLVAVLRAKAVLEEKALRLRYPGYADYARRVGRFIPGWL